LVEHFPLLGILRDLFLFRLIKVLCMMPSSRGRQHAPLTASNCTQVFNAAALFVVTSTGEMQYTGVAQTSAAAAAAAA